MSQFPKCPLAVKENAYSTHIWPKGQSREQERGGACLSE